MCKVLRPLFVLLLAVAPLHPVSAAPQVSLLTCSPGEELYTRYGHTAIRVLDSDNNIDWVFNYGCFSFDEPHFYLHFVQGQTWYMLGVESYRQFMHEYRAAHRPVCEQVLHLTPKETNQLVAALVDNARTENASYLYNFVFDNCATRPYHIICASLGDSVSSSFVPEPVTYRQLIHRFTRHGSWAELGINLVFGYKADAEISVTDRLFLPEQLMLWMQQARRGDGTPLVTATGGEAPVPFDIQPVPWYATWYFGLVLLVAAMVGINLYDRKRGQRSRWWDITLYCCYGLLAALLIFLIFFSVHPLVSIGWRIFIVPALHLCSRLIYLLR